MRLVGFLSKINEAAGTPGDAIQLLARAMVKSKDSNAFDEISWEDDDVLEQATELLKNQYNMIMNSSKNGNIKVFRMVCIPDINKLDKNNLGSSWTNHAGSASCWNEQENSNNSEFLIAGIANENDIDWIETLYHQSHGDFYDESEIRLLPNRKIQIQGIVQRDGRAGAQITDAFIGSTGSSYHNDIANRGADFVKYHLRGVNEEKMVDVWHLTDKQNVPSIMQNGLEPRIGTKSRSAKEKKNRIYVFPDLTSVEDALTNWWYDNTEFRQALLQLRLPASWVSQDKMRWEATIDKPVPPEFIKVMHDDVSDLASL